jgi:hypothetical protein
MLALFALGVFARERGWLSHGLSPQLRRTCGWAAAVGVVLATLVGVGITTSERPAIHPRRPRLRQSISLPGDRVAQASSRIETPIRYSGRPTPSTQTRSRTMAAK